MQLSYEVNIIMNVPDCDKTMKCTVFDDNNGVLELATTSKMRPRTKNIDITHHYFREHVKKD